MSDELVILLIHMMLLGITLGLLLFYMLLFHLLIPLIIRYYDGADAQEEAAAAATLTAHIAAARPPDHVQIVYSTYDRKNSGEGGGCAICLEEYKDGEACAAIAACNHRFHACCVEPWLIKNDTCPLCRTIV